MKLIDPEINKVDEDYYLKLEGIFENINEWLRFAEQKNAALLLLNGGMIWGAHDYWVSSIWFPRYRISLT